jgi:nucleotide-binding universal stress UspA family protein
MFERILVPLDGSELAEGVLAQVRRILFRKDSEVLLVRAVTLPPGMGVEPGRVLESLRSQAVVYLKGLEQKFSSQGVRVRSVVRDGGPAEVILDVAEKEKASLIALSTHGRTGLARWILGSVAEKVVRASPIPVLAVRSFEGTTPIAATELALKKIVVAIDAADLSLGVLGPAIEMARLFGSQVFLVNVCEGHPACSVPVPQMTRAHEQFRGAGVSVEPLMMQGDPASGILDACTEKRADLIAISTHGRSGVSRWMVGSVAEKVLRAATVPLLVVRSPGR